ncbi:MAG: hypothetical protein ASARMPRED_004752 [Alectoria sarmentosa]|nr:MAG: hypothetical protein ASARMPRED_004752 [Alectoria sarmentosa]
MKIYYLLIPLLASFEITANPMGGSDTGIYGPLHSKVNAPVRAPDPPPAGTPLPLSPDGVMPDNSIINYSPSTTPTQNSCWTSPLSRPPPSKPYVGGTCSVCVVQRSDNDGSADYQLWARDSKNNAMGNMDPTTVRPLDGTSSNANAQTQPSIAMGGSPLQLWAMLSSENPAYSVANLRWVVPPHDPSAPLSDTTIPQAMFDPTPGLGGGNNCAPAGTAPNGVVYFACTFAC